MALSARIHRRYRASLGWLFLLAALALAAGLGMREPSPPDEPRFALAARHMVESGDWLLPRRGSEIYAEKPPVFMWMQAASLVLVRDGRVAFLLPSLLAALGTLWLVADLASRLWHPRHAPYAMGALFACLQFGLQAKRAQIDMVLVCLTTLALWGLLRHLLRGPDWRAAWLGAFAAGVGTVTKGVGFLPLLVLLPWAFARSSAPAAPQRHTAWHWVGVALAFVAGTAVWLGPLALALARDGDPALRAYASELLLRQTGERYASAWHHHQPAWYYLEAMLTLWLPGVLLLPWLLPAWWRRIRRGDARYRLLLGWAVLVLVFFTLSPGKRGVYVFPMLPALCVAAAPLLPTLLRRRAVRATLLAWLVVLSLALATAAAAALSGHHDWALRAAAERALAPAELQSLLAWLLALGVVGLALAAWAAWSRLRRTVPALLAFVAALWTVFGIGIEPALDRSSSARGLMHEVGRRIGPGAQLGLVSWREQQVLQADRPVVDFGFHASPDAQWRAATVWLADAPANRWILLPAAALQHAAPGDCIDATRIVHGGRANRETWWLVPGEAVDAGCVAAEPAS